MIEQDIFNKVWDYFITQGNPSGSYYEESEDRRMCYYRTPDGNKCAIGLLIPDDNYSQYMEGYEASEVLATALPDTYRDALLFGKLRSSFLYAIRGAHDSSAMVPLSFRENFKAAMEQVARDYNLTIPERDM